MKRILLLILIPAALQAQLIPQKYLTLGLGFSETIYSSSGLDLFIKEFNNVNHQSLAVPLHGFDAAEGVRFDLGYRRFARWGMGVLAGAHFHQSKNGADFGNGDTRRLNLKMSELFVEYQMGRVWGNVFLNAVCTFSFNRNFRLESSYETAVDTLSSERVLNGSYKAAKSISTDLGIVFGFLKEPMIVSVKISYPIYSGGGKKIFYDKNPAKGAAGFGAFPSDYSNFIAGNDYKGVTSDVESVKILVTAAFLLRLR